MSFRVTVHTDQIAVTNALQKSHLAVVRVSRKIANYIAKDLDDSLGGIIPRAAGTSVTGFRRVRSFHSNTRVRRAKHHSKVWLGGNRIAARYGGRMREVTGGAYAGRHFFANAFIHQFKSGYKSLFTRVNGKLTEETIEVPNIYPIAVREIRGSKFKWEQKLRRELNNNL